jgi:hypothetical protein
MKNIIGLLPVIIFLCSTCKVETKWLQSESFKYAQTSCADAWQTGSSDSITCINVSQFLISKNIFARGVFIKNDGVSELCNACNCKTGNNIYLSTFGHDSSNVVLTQLGFIKY